MLNHIIETVEELRELFGYPSELAEKKVISFLDHHCQDFISKSPFLVISTSDGKGNCDVSPRGDVPGFVYIKNEQQLVIPERRGNKRFDTLKNIIANPNVGLLFLIPGMGETLRVNGKARLTTDEMVLNQMVVQNSLPLVGIEVEVEECFIHCAKAFKRSGLWETNTWPDSQSLPSAAKILYEHSRLENSNIEEIEQSLKEGYAKRLY